MIQRSGYIRRSTTPIARKSRPSRVRRTSRGAMEQRADALWRARVRAAGRCRLCGSERNLEAAHGFARRFHGTRHDPRNGWCLCHDCHARMTDHPRQWDEFLREELGDQYEPLRLQSLAVTTPDYEAVIAELERVRG